MAAQSAPFDRDNSNNNESNDKSTKAKTNCKWDQWGTNSYSVMPHVSPKSKAIAESYRLRPSDVVVLSFPKTGTTWTQTVCEQIRTNAEGYEGFGDITERQPWLEFAYDCGQDLDEEKYGLPPKNPNPVYEDGPVLDERVSASDLPAASFPPSKGPLLTPRIFKSHQLLSAINPGAKYLCIVRDPASTLLSWFDFQKAKGRPGYAEYEDANEYIANRPELFCGKHIFGTNLWEMYAEIWSARKDPSVKILVYEGLIADAPNGYMDHLPIIANFLGCSEKTNHPEGDESSTARAKRDEEVSFYKRVASMISRDEMMKHVDRFDDHFIAEMGQKYGRALKIMEPAPKVRSQKNRTALSAASLEWLEDQWLEKMTAKTGHATYDEFATELSEWLFARADSEEGHRTEARISPDLEEATEATQCRKSSSRVARRNSSLVLQQMPGLRQRRESLAPHE